MKKLIFSLFVLLGCTQSNITDPSINIIPKPLKISEKEGNFILSSKTGIISTSQTSGEADYLAVILENAFEKAPSIKSNGKKGIILRLNPEIKDKTGEEGYVFTSTKKSIIIEGATTTGVFYGIQTLRQLLPPEFEQSPDEKKLVAINIVGIVDNPRFPWRAFMLDEARYFKGIKVVKSLLDQMALHKMNVFHWHMVDDQGWRIEIKKYPELTEVGSRRANSMIGGWGSNRFSGEPHEGFYTQEEIKEIIQYATKRHITIVPEIEMPGHSASAIASYPWLGSIGKEIKVPGIFGGKYDIYNVTDPKVEQFLKDVLTEIMDLFPSEVIHIGGDEVDFNKWKTSTKVLDYMKREGLNSPADLQISFTNKISAFIESHDRRMMGWNEILGGVSLHQYHDAEDMKTSQELAPKSIVHFWKGDLTLAEDAVKRGYDIVNSLHSMTYLDYDYETITLEKAYSFDPVPEGLDSTYHHKVLGLGCQMWGEWIPTVEQMEYMVFPRMSAYAEVGWTEKSVKDFEDFTRRLRSMRKRWDILGIKYADF